MTETTTKSATLGPGSFCIPRAAMKRCKTCKHWLTPDESENYNKADMCSYRDPTTFENINAPFEVRICEHPSQRFCERPLEKDGFSVADGSTYFACLATAEDFGCVRHEALR